MMLFVAALSSGNIGRGQLVRYSTGQTESTYKSVIVYSSIYTPKNLSFD